VAVLVDTNILVYRYDPRDPRKQRIADDLLRTGLQRDSVRLPHQVLIEFHAVVKRSIPSYGPLLNSEDALREIEEMLAQYEVIFPNETVFRTALRGMATHQLSWFDAHLWAYAETFGIPEIISEDFQHGRTYGGVRVINPFR
jgi:predicted nucleic acid-binding protein